MVEDGRQTTIASCESTVHDRQRSLLQQVAASRRRRCRTGTSDANSAGGSSRSSSNRCNCGHMQSNVDYGDLSTHSWRQTPHATSGGNVVHTMQDGKGRLIPSQVATGCSPHEAVNDCRRRPMETNRRRTTTVEGGEGW